MQNNPYGVSRAVEMVKNAANQSLTANNMRIIT
jgi:hypothetical protein